MKTIGLIDYYLDERHANEVPKRIAKESDSLKVSYAFAVSDSPAGGLTTDQWCYEKGIKRADTFEEIVDKCDCLLILSPDHPEQHENLCRIPLMSGKRVYIDSMLATSRAAAIRIVELADKYYTPLYSASALRFAKELENISTDTVSFIDSRGPGTFEINGLDQFEILVHLMGTEVKRVMFIGNKLSPAFLIEYINGRRAITSCFDRKCSYNLAIQYGDDKEISSTLIIPDLTEYYDRFIKKMVHYFLTGEVPVPAEQTIAAISMMESAYKAIGRSCEWIPIE